MGSFAIGIRTPESKDIKTGRLLLIAALNSQLVNWGFIPPSAKRSTGGVSAEGEKAAKTAFFQDFPQVGKAEVGERKQSIGSALPEIPGVLGKMRAVQCGCQH